MIMITIIKNALAHSVDHYCSSMRGGADGAVRTETSSPQYDKIELRVTPTQFEVFFESRSLWGGVILVED